MRCSQALPACCRLRKCCLLTVLHAACCTKLTQRLLPPCCRGDPQPELPGGPVGLPRHPVTASGLQACKKRKGTHTSSRQERVAGDGGDTTSAHAGGGGGRGRASSEAYEWDDAWDERSDVSFSLPAGQPVDG